MKKDRTEREILHALIENSRLSIRKIAKKTGHSPATIMGRMKQLEKAGIIKNYTTTVDYDKLGYEFCIISHVRVLKAKHRDVGLEAAKSPNVIAVYDVTGPFDMVILARFKNNKKADAFLKKLRDHEFVERTETMIIMHTLKEAPLQF